MLLGTRMTNNEPSAITDLDVVARYDATDPNYVIKDSSNRISALLDKSKRLANGVELFTNGYNLVDSNSDGLADGFIIFNNVPTTKSIITGNGFPGKAQRVESINTNRWGLSIGNITDKKVYKLSFYYRTNRHIGVSDGNYGYTTLPANNGMAIQKEIIFTSSPTGLRPVYFGFFETLDSYIEIGNITIKEIIGNHITQIDTAKMPIHTYDNDTKEWFAQFDGVDDYLKSLPFTLNQPTSIYSCLKQNSWTVNDYIIDGNTSGSVVLYQNPNANKVALFAGSQIAIDSLIGNYSNVFLNINSISSKLKVNNNFINGSIGSNNLNGVTIGANASGLFSSSISVKEIIIKRIATDESDTIFNYFKKKHNVQY